MYKLTLTFLGILIGTIVYAIYIQFSPKLGNMWLRRDHENKIRFRPGNLFHMMIYPFKSIHFWRPSNLDLNYVLYAGLGGGIFGIIGNLFVKNKR